MIDPSGHVAAAPGHSLRPLDTARGERHLDGADGLSPSLSPLSAERTLSVSDRSLTDIKVPGGGTFLSDHSCDNQCHLPFPCRVCKGHGNERIPQKG